MKAVLIAAAFSLIVGLFGTPMFIKFLVHRGYGQFIRDDGPTSHHTKRGTPTMGGAVIIAAAVSAYAVAHLVTWSPPSISGLLVLFLMSGLGLVGFLDDYIKISRQRSLGLRSMQKLAGQGLVALIFSVLVLEFPNRSNITPASTAISTVRDTVIDVPQSWPAWVGLLLFLLWANLIIAGTSNGVNLTDGLDGLATGASTMVFAAYVIIGTWQTNQSCLVSPGARCYEVRDPRDLAVVAACLMGACFGFLWWNGSPAKIFMGDTGSLALGGGLAGLAICTRTELLVVVLGGLFVIEALSVMIQVGFFKATGKRVFRMAPLHHHFELVGWNEVTVVIRFWIIAGLCVALGLGLFYGEWVVGS
ncbi:phospho-N-acetylmuramoyl-pentapeptide-transferase [Arsenicicoccus piscis]|uniref:Phospho-N-acetylmuramoyl-pentapeptide-transferase n=1 Tax=Arsenicicoccus piscis TaxID=673954 RepID=A0ABQ6HMK6_9MICO|nr:phospho-N-acetylmuramoyl-pentapeptide-transferase [Arsenicicoccus piscis]MCH8627108.1 phospho-N-acetylmuramoyl-pentapeptide-transferase [Arsenicicoccus piscis]GMA18944.1 phospho-N-acetylmuramoyl-pentapeptide-transferase [Arsenicicoccus piscis]